MACADCLAGGGGALVDEVDPVRDVASALLGDLVVGAESALLGEVVPVEAVETSAVPESLVLESEAGVDLGAMYVFRVLLICIRLQVFPV